MTGAADGSGLTVRAARADEVVAFDAQLGERIIWGRSGVGDYLRQIVERAGQPVALLVWGRPVTRSKTVISGLAGAFPSGCPGSSSWCKPALSAADRQGPEPQLGLASFGGGLARPARAVAGPLGYAPLLARASPIRKLIAGTCYKASNWEPVGWSAGYRRHRPIFMCP